MSKVVALPNHVSAEQENADLVKALEKVLVEAKAGKLRAVAIGYATTDTYMYKSCAGRYSDLLACIEVMKHDLMLDFREHRK